MFFFFKKSGKRIESLDGGMEKVVYVFFEQDEFLLEYEREFL